MFVTLGLLVLLVVVFLRMPREDNMRRAHSGYTETQVKKDADAAKRQVSKNDIKVPTGSKASVDEDVEQTSLKIVNGVMRLLSSGQDNPAVKVNNSGDPELDGDLNFYRDLWFAYQADDGLDIDHYQSTAFIADVLKVLNKTEVTEFYTVASTDGDGTTTRVPAQVPPGSKYTFAGKSFKRSELFDNGQGTRYLLKGKYTVAKKSIPVTFTFDYYLATMTLVNIEAVEGTNG